MAIVISPGRGKAMRRAHAVLSMAMMLFATSPAMAGEIKGEAVFNKTYQGAKDRVMLYPNNFGAEAEFIHAFANRRNSVGEDKFIDPRDVLVGRFDLNGDGVRELFVTHDIDDCFYGCGVYVFQFVDGAWVQIGLVSARFGLPPQTVTNAYGHVSRVILYNPPDPVWLFASDERVDGWRTLLDYGWRYRWVPGPCKLQWVTGDGCYDETVIPEKYLDLMVGTGYQMRPAKNLKSK